MFFELGLTGMTGLLLIYAFYRDQEELDEIEQLNAEWARLEKRLKEEITKTQNERKELIARQELLAKTQAEMEQMKQAESVRGKDDDM